MSHAGSDGVPVAADGRGPDITRSITSMWQKEEGEGSEAGGGYSLPLEDEEPRCPECGMLHTP